VSRSSIAALFNPFAGWPLTGLLCEAVDDAAMTTIRRAVTLAALGTGPVATAPAAAQEGALRTAVLVEGPSDRAAVEALAAGRGRDLAADGVLVLDMGGATNVARFVTALERADPALRIAGLCDYAQRAHYRRALDQAGVAREHVGLFVCVTDLEDELIRTLGTDVVEDVIRAEGELAALATFRQQPAQRPRTLDQQLHRFLGTLSGRKTRYAAALATRCGPHRTPAPLRDLLDFLAPPR
jgi:hypothetical protein